MPVKIVYGDIYSLLVEWLSTQHSPFLVLPNVTAGRVLVDRLTTEGRGHLAVNLMTGRVGRLAAELLGPGEDISTIDLVIEREILRRLLPPEYRNFGTHDPFMDQTVRELDDLRRNCPGDYDLTPESLLSGAAISPREHQALASALRLLEAEQESVAPLKQRGMYLGAGLVRSATTHLRESTGSVPWSAVAVAGVHRLDSVSKELFLTLAHTIDVVFFPGPRSVQLQSIVAGWKLSEADAVDGQATGNAFVRRYLLGNREMEEDWQMPTVEAFPDRDRELRGTARAVRACLELGTAPRECLVAGPRVDSYADSVAAVCSEFGLDYHVAALRFFASLPIDRLTQSILSYLTAPAKEEVQKLGEVLTRSGCGFIPFRILALRERVGARGRTADEWISAANHARWPEGQINRLRVVLRALTTERHEWQQERSATEWLRRITRLLTDLRTISNLGRDLVRRARQETDAELAWEGQGTRRYIDRIASFSRVLAAGGELTMLSWERMTSQEFTRLFNGEVSFGSYLPSQTNASAIRFVDVEDVLFQDIAHLWVIDFTEGALPLDYSKPFLVPEHVREQLAQRSGILTRDRHMLLQRGNFEKVFAAPRRSLHFTYPYQDERAHTRLPSPLALTYGLLTGPGMEQVVAERRQAHEYFPRVPTERPTLREATGLAVQALNSPAPPKTDAAGVAMVRSVRHICGELDPLIQALLGRGALFVHPSPVVDLSQSGLEFSAAVQPIPVDQLMDSGRCPFRVYARSVLRLEAPRRERWPEEPFWAFHLILRDLLTHDTWLHVLQTPAGPYRLGIFREAAQRAMVGDDSLGTRGFQEYVAKQAYEYVSRIIASSGSSGTMRKPLGKSGKVQLKVGRAIVEVFLNRIDEVSGQRVAVVLVASPFAVEHMWNGAFVALKPVEGGDPRPAAVALGADRVDAVELHSLTSGRNNWERLFENCAIDRQPEGELPGDWDPKIRHLGREFDRSADESLKAALDAVSKLVKGERFEINPQQGACRPCCFGALCQRRWLPFLSDQRGD